MKSYFASRGATARRVPAPRTKNPAIASQPVRKVVTKRTKRVVGYFSSVKMSGLVPWESYLEYDYLCLLEVDNTISTFAAQPELLLYPYEGKIRRYYPDLRIGEANRTRRVVEVKYQSDADDSDNKELFDVFRDIYASRKVRYDVVTERTIRQQPRLANARLLLEARDSTPSKQLLLQLAEAFTVHRPATLGDLEATLRFPSTRRGDLFGMALRGHFDIDITRTPLSADSRVFGRIEHLILGERK
jgi:hypothetical protein